MADFILNLAPALARGYLRLLGLTCRFSEEGIENYRLAHGEEGKAIWVLWHNRLLGPIPRHVRKNIGVVISQSRDGEMISRVVEPFGYKALRGSSSRGGAAALRGVLRHSKDGNIVAFTPDGPRGPRYTVHPGVAYAAQRTGLYVMPMGVSSSKKKVFGSWDRFQMPLPFSRIQLVYGKPLLYSEEEGIEGFCESVRRGLISANERADELLGVTSP